MTTEVTVPAMGESITEAVILRWLKESGQQVAADDPLCELETDKATFDLPAPASGTLRETVEVGATVRVGQVVAQIEATPAAGSAPPPASQPPASQPPATQGDRADRTPQEMPPRAPRPEEPPTPPAAVEKRTALPPAHAPTHVVAAAEPPPRRAKQEAAEANGVRREPLSKIRRRIAERLVRAQQTTAMLTTFNEIDMTNVLRLREQQREQFAAAHGVSLGLMSFFARASVLAIKHFPVINAAISGDDVIYYDRVNLGIAVQTERGLVVPVLRHADSMSFATIEAEIKRAATAARDGKLSIEDLSNGTFTITNGGVFGSLLSTPILNPPQSAILGMHTIQRRPVCIGKRIRGRRMMYVALSYDHRLIDGHDAVQFLVKLKRFLEEPFTMMLE